MKIAFYNNKYQVLDNNNKILLITHSKNIAKSFLEKLVDNN